MVLRVILLTAAISAASCSQPEGSEEPTRAESSEAAEGAAQPERAETDPSADGEDEAEPEPAEPEGEVLEVVVKESQLQSSIPTDDRTVLHAVVDEGTLEVHIESLEAACGPVPELEARYVPGRVVLRLVPAADRHCIGRQEVKLRIDLPRRPTVETVRLRGASGEEIVSVDVPS